MGKKDNKAEKPAKDERVASAEAIFAALTESDKTRRLLACNQFGHQVITTDDHRVFCVKCATYLTDPDM